jgi:hypothetical protein
VRKLLREGNLHWLPVYALVRQSDLGREGIINSGSYRFADHIYRNKPSGRGPFGRWIDALFLAMPATKAFHRRYKRCQDELRQVAAKIPAPAPIRVLAIPCGIPRDITEFCEGLDGDLKSRLHYYGMDLDPELLQIAEKWVAPLGLGRFDFIRGNALLADDYPEGAFDFVVSTGLGEFSTPMKSRSSTETFIAFSRRAVYFTQVLPVMKSAANRFSRPSSSLPSIERSTIWILY